MTVYGLITRYQNANPYGHFFDHDTLKFFGERISEMRILKATEKVKDISGEEHECYVLSSLQRKHPIRPTRSYHYFDVNTFKEVIV